ncbi:MAG: hypothetical protein A2219_08670 [Elusimicrobia bacterium RIFOXYA2_FULL_50_26]|nr:MAG: hypothetical protein A2219_08670 [Elusimicrobia bacterium RIFOXYA2_FULL_50_26]OGS25138.1 MAG: hypothetical protein A2314_02745 [Elusimicrobia bacterium RIFOXYB2_FULL_50_12]
MNIVLTGFMGTGKSAVGKALAQKLGWLFIDTDETIEKEVGLSVAEIFKRKGEPYFRQAESKAVALVSLLDKAVISCGGGVVLKAENMDELEKNGVVVCLTADPSAIYNRTRYDTGRPLLKVADPQAKIGELMQARSQFYQRCSLTVDTSAMAVDEIVEYILRSPQLAGR